MYFPCHDIQVSNIDSDLFAVEIMIKCFKLKSKADAENQPKQVEKGNLDYGIDQSGRCA